MLITVIALLLLLGGIGVGLFWYRASEKDPVAESPVTEKETPFVNPSPLALGDNGRNNPLCVGLSVMAGDVTYYVKEDDHQRRYGTIHTVDANGEDRLLYTAEGNIEYLTATAEQLYFVVTTYRDNGHFKGDIFCSLDREGETVTEHFVSEDRIIALFVLEDGIYYCTANERNGSRLMKTDALGREPEPLLEQPDVMEECFINSDAMYYICTNRIYRSDFTGQKKEELCSSLYMLGALMVDGDQLYYAEYDNYLRPTLKLLNLADGTVTPRVSYGENIRINYLNGYGDRLYFVKSTVDVEGNVLHGAVVSLDAAGGETTLFEADTEIYGLSISNGAFYFYDLGAGTASSLPIGNS